MLLETMTLVVALYCAEHAIDNCPEVHQRDLNAAHGIGIKGCFGRLPSGKRIIIIDDDEKGYDRRDTFYHEFGHFIDEIEGRDASAHGIDHRRSTRKASRYYRGNK